MGTPALTTRGFEEADFERVADLLHEAAQLALHLQAASGPKLVDFVREVEASDDVRALGERVTQLAAGFPMP